MGKQTDNHTLATEAFKKIKQLMLQKKIAPGQKLLYRELIDWLGMSKTPIINALNRLEQDGFIISEANRGFYVRPIDLDEIMESYEIRDALEKKAIHLAIKRGTPAGFAELEKKARAYDGYRDYKYDKKMMLNAEFHLQIAAMSGNKILKLLLRQNLEHMILRLRLDNFPSERMEDSSTEHQALLDAMAKKDTDRCIKEIETHLIQSRDHIIAGISLHEKESRESLAFFES